MGRDQGVTAGKAVSLACNWPVIDQQRLIALVDGAGSMNAEHPVAQSGDVETVQERRRRALKDSPAFNRGVV